MNTRRDLPLIIQTIDGRSCAVRAESIGPWQGWGGALDPQCGSLLLSSESKLEQALDRRLDQALEETFRGSDPISKICNRASKTVRNVMEYKFEGRQKPSIIVSDTDQRRLTILATDALQRFPEVAEELLSEMERADVVTAEAIPPKRCANGIGRCFRVGHRRDAPRKVSLPWSGRYRCWQNFDPYADRCGVDRSF